MQCPRCPSVLPELDVAEHIGRIHIGAASLLWSCSDCPFQSLSLYDALTHCFLESHNSQTLRSPNTIGLLNLAKKAQGLHSPSYVQSTLISGAHNGPTVPNSALNQNCSDDQLETNINQVWTTSSQTQNIPVALYSPSITMTPKSSRKRVRKNYAVNSGSLNDVTDSFIDSNSLSEMSTYSPASPFPKNDADINTGQIDLSQSKAVTGPQDSEGDVLECATCFKSVKVRIAGHLYIGHVVSHVTSCLKLKPFACTACGHSGAKKNLIKTHISNHHPGEVGINIMMPAKEQDEMAVRKGISDCFPSVDSLSWKGFYNK